jgi:hypothetical protein
VATNMAACLLPAAKEERLNLSVQRQRIERRRTGSGHLLRKRKRQFIHTAACFSALGWLAG